MVRIFTQLDDGGYPIFPNFLKEKYVVGKSNSVFCKFFGSLREAVVVDHIHYYPLLFLHNYLFLFCVLTLYLILFTASLSLLPHPNMLPFNRRYSDAFG